MSQQQTHIQDRQLLMAFANNHRGNLQDLLLSFFKFLHECTDLYVVDENPQAMGFKPGQAEARVVQAFRAFPYKVKPVSTSSAVDIPSREQKKSIETASSKPSSTKETTAPNPVATSSTGSTPQSQAGSNDKSSVSETKQPDPAVKTSNDESKHQATTGTEAIATGEKQIPVGNGGNGPGYVWTQTLAEVTVYLTVPKSTRGKDVECTIGAGNVKARLKTTKETLLEGEYPVSEMVDVTESTWTLNEDCLIMMLAKRRETWWPNVVKGHPEIDTSKVDSTKKVTEYDPETQAAIRKLIAQQQQQQGL